MRSQPGRLVAIAVTVTSLLLGPVVPGKTAAAPAVAIDWELQSELADYLSGRAGLYGVAVRNLDTGQTVLINADEEFLSASIYKVLVMYQVYEQLETGTLDADDVLTIAASDAVEGDAEGGLNPGEVVTVADALEAMVTVSSNTAAYRLARLVGGWGSVNAVAATLGMSGTGARDGYFRTTPRDMLGFFDALAECRLVSPDASRRMIRLLGRQQVNDRIPTRLPAEAFVAHKTGELPGVRNDAGVVYGPGGRYVIAFFSRWTDEDEATYVAGRVSRLVYDRYAR